MDGSGLVVAGLGVIQVRFFSLHASTIAVATLLLVASSAYDARAATLRVPEDFSTILAAVDAAVSGDSVLVGPGTWTERDTRSGTRASAFLKAGISVIGTAGSAATVLQGDPDEPDSFPAMLAVPPGEATMPIVVQGLTLRCAGPEYAAIRSFSNGAELQVTDVVMEQGGVAFRGGSMETLVMRNCVVRDNDGTVLIWATVGARRPFWDFENCTFERNVAPLALLSGDGEDLGTEVRITGCRFVDNSAIALLDLSDIDAPGRADPLKIRGNWFEGNSTVGFGCLLVADCLGDIQGNTFVGNIASGAGHDGMIRVGGFPQGPGGPFAGSVDVTGNTFFGNQVPVGSSAAAITLRLVQPFDFHSNVFVGCVGGAAVRWEQGYHPTDGCNLFWDNEAGDFNGFTPQPTDIELDPQFCDPAMLDFRVAASSPCLDENNVFECGDVGAHGVGCPATDLVVTVLLTEPSGLLVTIDGVQKQTPTHVAWLSGSNHQISAPTPQAGLPSERFAFASWSDGGAVSHSVRGPEGFGEFTATFGAEFLLTRVVQGPGTIVAEDWMSGGVAHTITAVPDSLFDFVQWAGHGSGSYSGPDNPATVTPLAPITQWATFVNQQFELTMVAGAGGSVTPTTGPRPSFEVVGITALPDSRHVFAGWEGTGLLSYSGPDSAAIVTMLEPVTEVARFEPIAYELTLSLSDVDPHVHTGAPIGFGSVYLWLDCGTAGGVTGVNVELTGDLNVVNFTPGTGILNAGTVLRPLLASSECLVGPTLLGAFTVLSPGAGSLCLAAGSPGGTNVTSCALPPANFAWPADLKVTGVSTAGEAVCQFGRGCTDSSVTGSTPVSTPDPGPISYRDEWIASFPNPFTREITIRFSLASAAPVQLSVFDVRGRRIRSVLNTSQAAGRHDTVWNGRDDTGRAVPAGIYFVRLEAATIHETRKVTYLGLK